MDGLSAAPRLTLLFCGSDGTWEGDVESFNENEVDLLDGSPDTVMGRNSAKLTDGRYRIEASLSERSVSLTLDLHPMTRPVIANDIRLSAFESIRWVVVPHLRASGEVAVNGRRIAVQCAPAYHDRNWGRFSWGGGYAWEGAAIIPVDITQPWCLVYSRISDNHRGATRSQSLILWRYDLPSRKFYGRDLSISHEGVLRRDRVLRLPRVTSLLMPGTAADVPRRLLVSARGHGDELTVRMTFDNFAQVVVPNDQWPGLTALSETKGYAEVVGRIGVERVHFDARVQAEFNHAIV